MEPCDHTHRRTEVQYWKSCGDTERTAAAQWLWQILPRHNLEAVRQAGHPAKKAKPATCQTVCAP